MFILLKSNPISMSSGYTTLFGSKNDDAEKGESLRESVVRQGHEVVEEIKAECYNVDTSPVFEFVNVFWQNFVRVPTIPAFNKPGWLLRYIIGPHYFTNPTRPNYTLFESLYSDFFAGITVAFTLIPQALSYATLAYVPPINGIYSAILPSVGYVFFGSSMHLGLGPAAIVNVLVGQLVIKYNIDYTKHPQDAIDFTGQLALVCATVYMILSVLNLGSLIHLVNHPVMSGFTTGTSWYIGIGQLKNLFGFSPSFTPQAGQVGYDYNYELMQWFVDNWFKEYTSKTTTSKSTIGKSYQNHYATSIGMGIFWPLVFVQFLRYVYPATPERKKSWLFNFWNIASSLAPFIATIVGARVAYVIKMAPDSEVYYANTLKVVGPVPSGLNFLHSPSQKYSFADLIGDSFIILLVAFVESYSVAHRMAVLKNELWFLNASQEMFAVGVSNFLTAVSSGFPVGGSFSRTALNAASGSRTAMSKGFTVIIMVITLVAFSDLLTWIPFSALAAIVCAALFNLQKFSDFWQAWKHSKKDFFVIFLTFVVTFIFDTGVGLSVGICVSFAIVVFESIFSAVRGPVVQSTESEKLALQSTAEEDEKEGEVILDESSGSTPTTAKVEVIKLRTDVNFITVQSVTESITDLLLVRPDLSTEAGTVNDKVYYHVTSFLDSLETLPYQKAKQHVTEKPAAVAVDFSVVRFIDLTAMLRIDETLEYARKNNVKIVLFNLENDVAASFAKFGIRNDVSSSAVNLEYYLSRAKNLPTLGHKGEESSDEAPGSAVLAEAYGAPFAHFETLFFRVK